MESGNKKVIYTAIFGRYNGLIPQPVLKGFDFVCFTDDPSLQAHPWDVKVVEPPVPGDNTRSNRYFKILPHKFFQEYEESIYIDGNMLIIGDLNELIFRYLNQLKMAAFSHEFTVPDARNCIYDEHQGILDLGNEGKGMKDDPQIMEKFIDKIRKENYPANNGLIKGSCLLRKHNDPEVIAVMESWWETVAAYSKRDQLSFNYTAWKHDFEYATIPGDLRRGNPWVYWLGNHRSNWNFKLLKFRVKKSLGLIKFPDL